MNKSKIIAEASLKWNGADFKIRLEQIGRMSSADYLQQRKMLAKELGIPCGLLDEERKRLQKEGPTDTAVMRPYWNVEPWHEPVDCAELVRQIEKRIRRHVIMNDHTSVTIALWTAFAWVHDEAAVHSPILLVNSPEPDCGKTTLLGLLALIAPRGAITVGGTSSVTYRMIEKWHPTLIVDEADDQFKKDPDLRVIVNSAWTRGVGVPRCHPDTHEPEFFETFGPKAIGLKGLNVPNTTLTRAIIIGMERKLPHERAEDFSHIDDEGLEEIRRKLARFAADNTEKLAALAKTVTLPEGFTNRLAANWRLLLAIAELAGMGPRAREAALVLSWRADEASLGVELLRDIRSIFEKRGVDRIRSEELVNKLGGMADRPWAEMP